MRTRHRVALIRVVATLTLAASAAFAVLGFVLVAGSADPAPGLAAALAAIIAWCGGWVLAGIAAILSALDRADGGPVRVTRREAGR